MRQRCHPFQLMAKAGVCAAVMALGTHSAIAQQKTLPGQQQRPSEQLRQQQEQQNWQRAENVGRTSTESAQAVNQFLASKLILCNNGEIELAQMIQEKTDSQAVKGFAKKVAEDHKTLNTMLAKHKAPYSADPNYGEFRAAQASENVDPEQKRYAGGATERETSAIEQAAREAARLAAGQEVTDVTNPDTPIQERTTEETSMRVVDSAPLKTLYDIASEAAMMQKQQCKKMLQEYQGYDLDMAYVGSQIASHQMLLSELKAIEKSTSGDIQMVARKGATLVEQHLQQAKQLTRQLETEAGRQQRKNAGDQLGDNDWSTDRDQKPATRPSSDRRDN